MSKSLAQAIDHTLLKADATQAEVEAICDEALQHGFASVCVNGRFVPFVAEKLRGSAVKTVSVVGFPLGAMSSKAKAFETRQAVDDGAQEIDMVLAVGALKDGDLEYVTQDIAEVVKAAGSVPVKVILETALLSDSQKEAACLAAKKAGAAFVKTSTGFSSGGATVADVALMRRVVGDALGVKASGGIRNTADAQAMIQAGANRLGCSASVAIVGGGKAQGEGY